MIDIDVNAPRHQGLYSHNTLFPSFAAYVARKIMHKNDLYIMYFIYKHFKNVDALQLLIA